MLRGVLFRRGTDTGPHHPVAVAPPWNLEAC